MKNILETHYQIQVDLVKSLHYFNYLYYPLLQ
jgi:hypothetical protein